MHSNKFNIQFKKIRFLNYHIIQKNIFKFSKNNIHIDSIIIKIINLKRFWTLKIRDPLNILIFINDNFIILYFYINRMSYLIKLNFISKIKIL